MLDLDSLLVCVGDVGPFAVVGVSDPAAGRL